MEKQKVSELILSKIPGIEITEGKQYLTLTVDKSQLLQLSEILKNIRNILCQIMRNGKVI